MTANTSSKIAFAVPFNVMLNLDVNNMVEKSDRLIIPATPEAFLIGHKLKGAPPGYKYTLHVEFEDEV